MNETYTIDLFSLDLLFSEIKKRGYQLLGPTIQEGTIVYDEVNSTSDFPVGWTDEQEGGTCFCVSMDTGPKVTSGFDPLYVANEGRFVAFVPLEYAEKTLSIMHSHPLGKGASIIGKVEKSSEPLVKMKSSVGTTRLVEMLTGEQLPRIC